ncbi:MAG: hypothetical protein ACPGWR_32785, partial [Ardenticatenaceae bacterium]
MHKLTVSDCAGQVCATNFWIRSRVLGAIPGGGALPADSLRNPQTRSGYRRCTALSLSKGRRVAHHNFGAIPWMTDHEPRDDANAFHFFATWQAPTP